MFLNHKTRREPLLVFLHEQGMISGESLEVLLQAENLNPINRWYSILPQLVDGLKNHDEKIEPFSQPLLNQVIKIWDNSDGAG